MMATIDRAMGQYYSLLGTSQALARDNNEPSVFVQSSGPADEHLPPMLSLSQLERSVAR